LSPKSQGEGFLLEGILLFGSGFFLMLDEFLLMGLKNVVFFLNRSEDGGVRGNPNRTI